ncbi:hypothetical protein [Okeania sp.]|uniref:hypothetical protein n=1 Tax=Okeania sp. TaxID=3100323 RepID=UPI002B4B63E0|nr:hypothetical protein [Okeania sp.]MEB3341260.1 hypothetical protein [Okeania sp.]
MSNNSQQSENSNQKASHTSQESKPPKQPEQNEPTVKFEPEDRIHIWNNSEDI